MNIIIVYHDADFDGKMSNEVCRYHLKRLYPEANIVSFGWDYGQPIPEPGTLCSLTTWDEFDDIYIVDLSVDELMARSDLRKKITWIDHHKSAIDKWDSTHNESETQYVQRPISGLRIDGVAACRLCWQYFAGGNIGPDEVCDAEYLTFLVKDDFYNHGVTEPKLLRLVGEYDVWDHRDPDAKALQFGLRAMSSHKLKWLIEQQFAWEIQTRGNGEIDHLAEAINSGYAIKFYCDTQNKEYSSAYARTLRWEGLTFCALNIGQRGNSDLFVGGLKPEHQACFAWRFDGEKVAVSLYHAPGHESLDLTSIAKKYGRVGKKGGGHRGACGFRISLRQLTYILENGVEDAWKDGPEGLPPWSCVAFP